MLGNFLLRLPYPKLILLLGSFYVARLILTDENNFYFHPILEQLNYLATFLAGFFFNFGFTFAPSVAILIVLAPTQNLWLAALLASFGSIIGNFIFYRIIKISFADEIKQLYNMRLFRSAYENFVTHTPAWLKRYVLPIFAGIIVATPLPDELAVALIAACHKISFPIFSIVSFVFSAFGILLILAIGKLIA